MIRIIPSLVLGVIISCYYFPFQFQFLPGINTKMILAAIGLIILGLNLARGRKAMIDKAFVVLSIIAILVSLIARISMVYNNTLDDSYASYFMSMWVWLGGAYAIANMFRMIYDQFTLALLSKYLVAVCVFQCFAALIIDTYPSVKAFINMYIEQGQDFLDKNNVERLYGIGAMLDTAGIRFSIVLLLLSHQLLDSRVSKGRLSVALYWVCFFIIVVVGNMIARTTTVGGVLALIYLLLFSVINKNKNIEAFWRLIGTFVCAFLIAVSIIIFIYNTNSDFAKDIRFAFEGFFSLAEKGEWQVGSNDQLRNMMVFPETIKTWLIGDGYFAPPQSTDPYYVGPIIGGYYMGTDIGYLRFIFYFGAIGLLCFSVFMCTAAKICANRIPEAKVLILFLLAIHFIVWLKVSTDCFFIFALLLMIDSDAAESKCKYSPIYS